jgi:hypothetical protein
MNNEPVAWAVWEGRPHDLFFTKEDADELCRLKGGDAKSVPLYTHSDQMGLAESIIKQQKIEIDALKNYIEAQNKKIIDLAFEKVYAERSLEIANQFNELTDGEITVLASRHLRHIECDYESTGVYEFARAILRKAQEK